MLMIEEYIKELGEYFEGIERFNKALIVKIIFPEKWGVYPSEDGKIKPAKSDSNPQEYYYYGDSDNVKLEDIFQLIIETKKMNESVVNKVKLLKEKIEELKEFFKDKDIKELETLQFITKKPKKKKNKKNVDNKSEETSNTDNKIITDVNTQEEEKNNTDSSNNNKEGEIQ